MSKVKPTNETAILAALTASGDPMGPKALAEAIGSTEGSVTQTLLGMRKAGIVARIGHGAYTTPERATSSGDGADASPVVPAVRGSATVAVRNPITILVHDVDASCGPPRLVETQTEQDGYRVTMDRDFLAGLLGFQPPPDMRALRARGRSMEPFIPDGRWCLYEPVPDTVSGFRYVFEIEEEDTGDYYLYIKRLQRLIGGGLKIISDNPGAGLDDETLVPDGGHGAAASVRPQWMRHAVTGARVRVHVRGIVLWPDNGEGGAHGQLINATIERLVARGALSGGL